MALMKEAEEDGIPHTRSLMLEYPDDPIARKEYSEFMLGSDLLMAPIFEEGSTARDVYLP